MTSKILIGNVGTDLKEEQIAELFSQAAGEVCAVSIPKDPRTGKCRGYAFVEMLTDLEAQQAVDLLNGQSINGRKLSLSIVETQRKRKWYQFGSG